MKHLLIVLMAFASLQAAAQNGETRSTIRNTETESQAGYELVPVLGLGAMSLKGDVSSDWNPDVAASGGGLFELGSGTTTLQTGLLYNTNSMTAKGEGLLGTLEVKVKWDYLSVPILAKFNFMGNSSRTVYMKLGVMPSFMTHKSIEANWGDYKTGDVPLKTFDAIAVGGIGGAIRVAQNKAIIIEGTYLRGLTDINGSGSGGKVYNEGFLITSGFSFGM